MNARHSTTLSSVFLFILAALSTAPWAAPSAQEQSAFRRAWQDGTPATIAGELTLQYRMTSSTADPS